MFLKFVKPNKYRYQIMTSITILSLFNYFYGIRNRKKYMREIRY